MFKGLKCDGVSNNAPRLQIQSRKPDELCPGPGRKTDHLVAVDVVNESAVSETAAGESGG